MTEHPLIAGLAEIANAPESRLLSQDWLVGVLRRVGLVRQPHAFDEADWPYLAESSLMGIFQQPEELASFLISLVGEDITTFLEVGTWTGWTIALMTAYLKRFVPSIQVTALDIQLAPSEPMHAMAAGLPLTFIEGESTALVGQAFDVVFIDADHRYDWARQDYESVGRQAKICAICDINDDIVSGLPCGGAARLWRELVAEPGVNYRMHALRPGRIGIGVLYQEPEERPQQEG